MEDDFFRSPVDNATKNLGGDVRFLNENGVKISITFPAADREV